MRAIIYARQSKDSEDGITRQLEKCMALVKSRGWELVHAPFTDNDVSASSGRKRPSYERAMTMICLGQADVIVVLAMDRLYRKVTELENIIPVMEQAGAKVVAVAGEYDLSTDTGRLVARILASVAQGEVETKARRQKDANAQRAAAGKRWGSSQRPFGWSEDDYTVPVAHEADAIREAARFILAGGTVSGIMRTWNAKGLRPAQAPFGPLVEKPWARQAITAVLTNPATAGMRRYRGQITARGGWQGIISEETFLAVNAILGDPSRKPPKGVTSLLGGIAVCQCGNVCTHTHAQQGHGVYRCQHSTRKPGTGPHVSIKSELADQWVTEAVAARMSQPDAVTMFAKDSNVDMQALRDEALTIRTNLDSLAADMALGIISRSAMITATERGNGRLAEIDAAIATASREHVAAELITAQDVRACWEALDLSRQRAIIRALLAVTLSPAGRGARFPDSRKVLGLSWAA
jgi:DNA invertase Pin-like site-specific DNA recombinase